MKNLLIIITLLLSVTFVSAQKVVVVKKPEITRTGKTIFAVINDGKQIEPIAYIVNKEVKPIIGDDTDLVNDPAFVKNHYKPKTKYNLIFGGANAGTVTVIKDLAGTDCAANQAEISVASKKVKPKGFVMALATDAVPKASVIPTRKLPTSAERLEIEKLVMAAMMKQNIPIKKLNELRYHNLTKVDVDNDGNPEFIGSYWYNTGDDVRSLMFFIADQTKNGPITIPYSKFTEYKNSDVMSGNVKDLDDGILHELLIDMFDIDADGKGEIFTMAQSFEGSNFWVYKKINGVWTQILETSNYHCGY